MTKERVYVKVSSDFDSTGYMQPTSITWSDGRTFPIETVRDFRPAGTADNGYSGDCFTVLIQGQEKHLFFEHLDPRFNGRLGRWFVERASNSLARPGMPYAFREGDTARQIVFSVREESATTRFVVSGSRCRAAHSALA